MSNNSKFFESPQAAAVYKHKLIKVYIPVWVGKVGSRSTGKRVMVYDAYSGPGRYEDANPGSPELLVDTALAMAKLRHVRTVFSEKEAGFCEQLEELLQAKDELDSDSYDVRVGPVEAHVDGSAAVLVDTFIEELGSSERMSSCRRSSHRSSSVTWSRSLVAAI